jgi:hypothetical protein
MTPLLDDRSDPPDGLLYRAPPDSTMLTSSPAPA